MTTKTTRTATGLPETGAAGTDSTGRPSWEITAAIESERAKFEECLIRQSPNTNRARRPNGNYEADRVEELFRNWLAEHSAAPICPECQGGGEVTSERAGEFDERPYAVVPCKACAGTGQSQITRLDVLSLIREHTHRCYVAGVDLLEVDPKHMQEIEGALRSLEGRSESATGFRLEGGNTKPSNAPSPATGGELDVEAERREFEEAAKEHDLDLDKFEFGDIGDEPGTYVYYDTQTAWTMWQVRARRAATGTPAKSAPVELPAALFDSHAVCMEVVAHDPETQIVNPAQVLDVLDAIVRLMLAPSPNSPVGAKEQDK